MGIWKLQFLEKWYAFRRTISKSLKKSTMFLTTSASKKIKRKNSYAYLNIYSCLEYEQKKKSQFI